jgi:hypothetical protein
MRLWLSTILFLSTLGLVGCAANKLTPEQAAAADYGTYPADYQQQIRNYFELRLKDPGSAQYRFYEPEKIVMHKAPIAGGGVDFFGYGVNVDVNAKNSFGAYVGFQRYTFSFRDGKMLMNMTAEELEDMRKRSRDSIKN